MANLIFSGRIFAIRTQTRATGHPPLFIAAGSVPYRVRIRFTSRHRMRDALVMFPIGAPTWFPVTRYDHGRPMVSDPHWSGHTV